MCGIYCRISRHGHHPVPSTINDLLAKRGPYSLKEHRTVVSGVYITLVASVLPLRGSDLVPQPLVDENPASVLCWNGEAWKINDEAVTGNDSQLIFQKLRDAASGTDARSSIASFLSQIRGPFACVFLDQSSEKLYFGRDCLGRRSLVKTTTSEGDIVISSVPYHQDQDLWTEVEADGMYVLSLTSPRQDFNSNAFVINRIPLSLENEQVEAETIRVPYPALCDEIPSEAPPSLQLTSKCIETLHSLLFHSVQLRAQNLPDSPISPLGVLFSGGLDSALLAYYAHLTLPLDTPIDLLNVAFQNPRIHKPDFEDPYSSCPDRKTGLSAWNALRQQCPTRIFNFVAINIPFTETTAHRQTIIDLMHPHKTEMDLSIASALYFASRGQGSLVSTAEPPSFTPYYTPTRVLLSGLGADELFGGYVRHATAFSRRGYRGLLDELELDFGRLGKRNLGRDDRVTSTWGREVRYPFLDEDVVGAAVRAPVWEKCGFGMPESTSAEEPRLEPGKLALRLLAWKAGLHNVAREPKRAIQFGSRTAKMSTHKSKGTDELVA
ncbi:hypothetical protein BT63DRAFT_191792 [Microthyrium microscopicum]|uniref:Glutamine amidotransferase type-2 domain-containing protein n=1 Tax=Microthyrium microscopicum TaxID=703497 RepID=A0A6A6UIX2_9PEZI|nr:hypothetical protein BT63DRAFT_191792 [Microthyrium microscopicum]